LWSADIVLHTDQDIAGFHKQVPGFFRKDLVRVIHLSFPFDQAWQCLFAEIIFKIMGWYAENGAHESHDNGAGNCNKYFELLFLRKEDPSTQTAVCPARQATGPGNLIRPK
jgi:hypothetical protein